MDSINNIYLGKHKKFRMDSKKLATAFLVISFLVAIVVFWCLKLVGITVTGEAFCGIDEHLHGSECYVSEVVCGSDEISQSTLPQFEVTTEEVESDDETEPDENITQESDDAQENTEVESANDTTEEITTQDIHTHTEDCYEKILVCTETEHTHTAECFPDKTADVETVSDWLATIDNVEITNDISENLIGIAMSQMGYEESFNNFEYDEDGDKNGYTRYGEWYGNPYGKWSVMFVSFCLHYSNVNNSAELKSAGAEAMRLAWQNRHAYASVSEHDAKRGDIVFIDSDKDKKADAVGIILYAGEESLQVIMGDSNNKVETGNMSVSDDIMGYGLTSELHFAKDTEYQEETQPTVSVEEETKPELPDLMAAETPELIDDTDHEVHYETDLTRFVTDVDIRTQDNVEITNNSTVYIGQTYIITMEFKEDNEGYEWYQFGHNDEHYLTYDIPSNFHCEPFTEWHSIAAKTENGTIEDVGKYFINEEGHLLVTFYDDEDGVCFGHRYSNVDFVIEFNATVGNTQSGSSNEVVFSDEIKVVLKVDGGAGMTVEKTHGSYDASNHTMDYTIKVEATHGVVKDLVIDDQIWETHYTLRDTIVVTDLDGNVLDPQPTVSDHPSHNTGAEEGFRLSGFPDFAAGDGFLITYKTKLYDDQITKDSVGLWNGLDTNGKDSDGKNIYVWAKDDAYVELEKMSKEGKQTTVKDANGNDVPVIEWEVAIKKNNSDLQGTVVIDTLGEGLEYYTGKDILIKHYDAWGNPLTDTYLSWDNVAINGNSMSFPLPEGYMFDIFYYTIYEIPEDGKSKNYTNSVSAEINGKQETTAGEADVVAFVPRVGKSARGNDGEYVYFTIEADVPAVIKDWGNFFLTDMSAFWGYNNAAGYLYVDNIPEDMTITAVTKSGDIIDFTPYVAGGPAENTYILVAPAEGDMHHSFKIYFNTSDANNASSKWILNEDSTLLITYKIPFDTKTGTEWSGELSGDKTVGDVLLEGFSLANEVYLNYTDVVTTTGSATYNYSPKITKNSAVNDDGTIDYTVVFYNSIPGTSGVGYLDQNTASAYFTDTFNEKLEYVEGSMEVTCYDPWRDWLWLNKYTYDGSINGNNINLSMSQFTYSETNPEASTVGWGGLNNFGNLETYYKQMSSWGSGGGKFIFTYTLKLKDEYLYTTQENKFVLDNTAEIKWDNDGSTGPVTETVEYKTGLMDKHVVQENNKLDFDIHINRNALDILPGADNLTIEDTMTENLSVYWDSIKLLYEDKNGNWIDFDSAESQKEYTVTYDQHSNRLTFVVPDSLHIRIDYTTLITQSGLVSVNNAVKIDAKAQVTDIIDAVFKVEQHSGGASGSMNSITLLKQDGDTDVALPDVTFLLYGPVGDPDAVKPADAQSTIVTDSNKTLRYIGSYTTGADGTVKIASQYLTNGGPYALVEAVPPTGYNKLEKPVYFYYYNTDPNGIIQTVTTLIAVENYTYGYVLPETGGTGTLPLAIVGFALMAFPILYSTIRRKRERRLT